METIDLQKMLCTSFCANIKTRVRPDGSIQVATPFVGRDGDTYNIYVKKNEDNSYKVTDKGSTIMRLSYETDLKSIKGARGEVLEQIIHEAGMSFDNGEIFIKTYHSNIPQAIFELGQALTRVSDIGLWNKTRVKSTFYEDLDFNINKVIHNPKIVQRNYYVPKLDKEKLFPIDYLITSENNHERPLVIFGVPDSSKARLAALIMAKLAEWEFNCSMMVILNGLDSIPSLDLARLMNAANDFVPDVTDFGAINKKITERLPSITIN